jgi:hypothetical protein
VRSADPQFVVHSNADIVIYLVCSVDVGSIGRTTYKLLSCDCVRVASQDPEEELAASNLLTIGIRAQVSCSDRRARFCAGGSKSVKSIQQEGCLAKPILKMLLRVKTLRSGVQTMDLAGP